MTYKTSTWDDEWIQLHFIISLNASIYRLCEDCNKNLFVKIPFETNTNTVDNIIISDNIINTDYLDKAKVKYTLVKTKDKNGNDRVKHIILIPLEFSKYLKVEKEVVKRKILRFKDKDTEKMVFNVVEVDNAFHIYYNK